MILKKYLTEVSFKDGSSEFKTYRRYTRTIEITETSTSLVLDLERKEISDGNVFTVGLKVNGTLWTWSSDSIGQLGNGTSSNSDVAIPTQISNQNWNSISTISTNVKSRYIQVIHRHRLN